MPELSSIAADAAREADAAAERAGVVIRDVHDVAGLEAMRTLFNEVWQAEPGADLMNQGLLTALAHSGNYCVAAYLSGTSSRAEMIGASGAWLGLEDRTLLVHSHITGVKLGAAARGVGHALKLHQRAWALERGISVITWTFDPLIRRNAYFNLTKLGARPVEYLIDFYGEMTDGINAGQGSDRTLCRWDLRAPAPAPAGPVGLVGDLVVDDGEPVVGEPDQSADLLGVQLPPDIEELRRTDPARAARWRRVVRDTMGRLMGQGWSVVGLDGAGRYLLAPPTDTTPTRPE
jgi:predicted GNAT superfamily acetyltransferase